MGAEYNNVYCSEIDEYALKISEKNYPDNIQLGDVTKVKGSELPKIDLLIAGFPCQSFSRCGLEMGFDDPRGKLFFETVRLLKEVCPKYFLLENTPMDKETENIISEIVGVKNIQINSALVTAQMRKRNYWTNIPVQQPKDKGILLRDVVDDDALVDADKAHAVIASIGRTTHREYFMKNQGQMVYDAIALSNIYGGFKESRPRVHVQKSPAIRTSAGGGHIPSLVLNIEGMEKEFDLETYRKFIRKIHPWECEALQGLPKGWTEGISSTQKYKCIGNGFTIPVISHILKGMNKENWF